jgi:hypothetical protein
MSAEDSSIQLHECPDDDLPEVFRIQVLDFLRIVWPDGFTGLNRFRDWTTEPDKKPHHLLYAADRQLISHLELITTTVSVNNVEYRAASPTAMLTYPAFRGEGWGSRLNARAAELIDASDAEIGLLTCAPNLIDFYRRAGWTHVQGTPIIAGPDGATWTSDDVLLTRPTSPNSARFLRAIKDHPLRVADEW